MDLIVNIDVDDLEKGVLFYASVFGLTVGRRLGSFGVELLGRSAVINLLEKPPGSAATRTTKELRRYERHWTPVHLDFVVDEIEPVVERAVAAGARLEEPISTHQWGRLALLADPFGHGLCCVQFLGRGYDEIASE